MLKTNDMEILPNLLEVYFQNLSHIKVRGLVDASCVFVLVVFTEFEQRMKTNNMTEVHPNPFGI